MSHLEEGFVQALHAEPADETTWLARADWLDDADQPDRAEMIRLFRQLRPMPVMRRRQARTRLEERLCAHLLAGVAPPAVELVNSADMRFALVPAARLPPGRPPPAGRAAVGRR